MIRHSERLPQPALTGGLRTMTLPDGRQVLTLCGDNTRIAYDEIFVEQIYAMFGVDLPEGATVFDVGANVGLAVLWVGDRISQGTVHAFEPIPATFAALRANEERGKKSKWPSTVPTEGLYSSPCAAVLVSLLELDER